MSKPVKGRHATFGKGHHLIDDAALSALSGLSAFNAEMARKIKNVIDDGVYRPPMLPEVAIALTQMANRPNVDFADVEKVVASDPLVAAKIVAVANSAFYNRGQPVRSLGLAIARLGLAAVRDVAFQVVAQTTIFKVSAYAARMRDLYQAAQVSGLLAREVCLRLKFESELAYLCGLLHDMGEAIILAIVADICKSEMRDCYDLAQLGETIDHLHAQVGARICQSWALPQILSDAILGHHQCMESANPEQMSLVLGVTDLLLRHIGVGVAKAPVDPMNEPLFFRLNMTPKQVDGLLTFAEEIQQESL